MDGMYLPNADTIERYSLDIVSRSARDLTLIKAIEQTLDALRYNKTRFEADASFALDFAERIKNIKPTVVLDESGKLDDAILRAQDSVKSTYLAYIEKRTYASEDRSLEAEDGIPEAFTETIAASAELYNALSDLRWTISEHDAELSGRIDAKICRTPEELDTALSC